MRYQHVIATRKGGPEVLEVVQADLRPPAPAEVRVRVQRAGAAFGDLLWQAGTVPGGPSPPFTPGYDVVGVVDETGAAVSNVQEGQTVAALVQYGGYTEYAYVPAGKLVLVPDGLDPGKAACLTLNYLTAYQLFHRVAALASGQRALVHGAGGGVGTAMLEIGRLMGLEMYGTASPSKHDLITSLGGTPIDYRTEDFVERISQLTGDGVDLVVDHIGGNHLRRSFRTLRRGGHLVSTSAYGSVRGELGTLESLLGFARLPIWNALPNGKSAMLFDIVGFNQKNPNFFQQDLKTLLGYLEEGRIEPVIAAVFPLQEARPAQEMLLRAEARGKVLLNCEPS